MTRVATLAAIVASVVLVLHARPLGPAAALSGVHEAIAFRLDGAPLRFRLEPGEATLRILVNADLPEGAPPEGLALTVRVEIPEDGRAERVPLLAIPSPPAAGPPAVFYAREPLRAARTREVVLERAAAGPGTLVLELEGAGAPAASVRVLAAIRRPPLSAPLLEQVLGDDGRARLARAAGPLPWEELPRSVREALLATRWAPVAAEPGARAVRLYVADAPPPAPACQPEGERLAPGATVAYALRGPGAVRLVATEGPLLGEVRILGASGREWTQPLRLDAGAGASLDLPAEPCTLRVAAGAPARVALLGPAALAMTPERVVARADGLSRLQPAWSVASAFLLQPGPSPLAYALSGRDGAPLRLSVRGVGPAARPPAEVQVTWRILDAGGGVVASGTIAERVPPAPEDRIDGEGLAVTAPVHAHVWTPPGAERLELRSTAPVAVAAFSPGVPRVVREPPAPLAPGIAWWFAERSGEWLRVDPIEAPAQGGPVHLHLAARLERIPVPETPPLAEALSPRGGRPYFRLVEPAPDGTEPGAGAVWPVPADRAVTVSFGPGARPRLLYAGAAGLAGSRARIRVSDSELVATLPAPRGELRLPPMRPGAHPVHVTLAAPARLFSDAAVAGAALHRIHRVYELRDGVAVRVPLRKGAAARSMGAVVYLDGPARPGAQLVFRVHAPRRGAVVTRGRTAELRAVPLEAAPVEGALWLDGSDRAVLASDPIFFRLDDDLAPGVHDVDVAIRGAGRRAFVRLFAYGADAPDALRLVHLFSDGEAP